MLQVKSGILKFAPNRVWRTYLGGRVLDQIEGRENPQDGHYPEDWIGSVVEARNPGERPKREGLARIDGEDGIVFRDLLQNESQRLLGSADDFEEILERLPLVKYLDSSTRLHFQVHPTSEFARERLNAPTGKTEAYVILKIREDIENPFIYAGFQRPPSRAQLKDWIREQDIQAIENCFDPIPVEEGDVFFIPGGQPHALGPGILLLEIMEPSDLAVRFEFERDGFEIPEQARFMGRDLETALDVFNLDPVSPERFRCTPRRIEEEDSNSVDELIGYDLTSCFAVRRRYVKGSMENRMSDSHFTIVESGSGKICTENGNTNLACWDRLFCSSGIERIAFESDGGMTLLECYPREKLN